MSPVVLISTSQITQPIRALGFMHVLDKAKFHYQRFKNRKKNKEFRSRHPDVHLPPDYMLFESFQLDYDKYFMDGLDSARWLISTLSPHLKWGDQKILDWGCGPARLARHLPSLLPQSVVYGTDYNPQTIEWCKGHIPSIRFDLNQLEPPTKYQSGFFDVIYGISIFTHLSERNHHAWYEELTRLLAPGGILLLTTQGEAFREKMTLKEWSDFSEGKLIVRDKAKEGHRVFAAFHPPDFMRLLFEKNATVLRHIPGKKKDWGIEQDTWILKKK